jgi:hypothetical protein
MFRSVRLRGLGLAMFRRRLTASRGRWQHDWLSAAQRPMVERLCKRPPAGPRCASSAAE